MRLIPQCALDSYKSITDCLIDEMGISCKLIYPKVETTTVSVPDIKEQRTLQPMSAPYGFKHDSVDYKITEITDTIKMLVYWSEKDFRKLGNVNVPEGGMMGITYLSNLPKIQKSSFIIPFDSAALPEYRFVLAGEPRIYGLTNEHLLTIWKRNV